MKKEYFLPKNKWLLSRVANSFTDNIKIGIKQKKSSIIWNIVILFASILLISAILMMMFFRLVIYLVPLFIQNEIVLGLLHIFTLILSIVVFFILVINLSKLLNKYYIKPKLKDEINIADLNNLSENIMYINLSNNDLHINQYNKSDIYINIPTSKIKNIYFLPGNLELYDRGKWFFEDGQDAKVARFYHGKYSFNNKNESVARTLIINDKKVIIQAPHGLDTINNMIELYNKDMGIKIEGNIEKDGFFLMIFTTDIEYHLLYIPYPIVEQGFIRDLELILNTQLNNTIKTPSRRISDNNIIRQINEKIEDTPIDTINALQQLKMELNRYKNGV